MIGLVILYLKDKNTNNFHIRYLIDETGKIYPLIYEEEEKPPIEMKINKPADLWKFIEKLLKTKL